MLETNSIWAFFMRARYLKTKWVSAQIVNASAKRIWKSLIKLVELSSWEIGPGNKLSIYENWLGAGYLAGSFPSLTMTQC